jgi:hypothetical protein
MAEASRSDVSALISALDDPSGAVRTAALRALVRLPLEHDVWFEVGDRIVKLFQMAPSGDRFKNQTVGGIPYWELIDAAIFVPIPYVRYCLYNLLKPDDDELRRAIAQALTKARDPMAISELVSELEKPDRMQRVVAAECLSFHDVRGVLDKIHEAYKQETHGETRFWLALALARQGELEYISQVFTELGAGSIDLPRYQYGDPARLTNKLRQLGPFPENVQKFLSNVVKFNSREFLRELHVYDGEYEYVGRIASNLLYRNIQSEQTSIIAPVTEIGLTEKEEAELARKASEQAQKLINEFVYEHDTKQFQRSTIDRETLRYLEPEPATSLISTIINYLVDEDWLKEIPNPDGFQQIKGNDIVTIASEFCKPFHPDVAALSDSYVKECKEVHHSYDLLKQIAWLISRAELQHILSIVSPHLNADDEAERIAAAQLIEDATRLRNWPYPPIFGGGPIIGDVPVPPPPSMLCDRSISAPSPAPEKLVIDVKDVSASHVTGPSFEKVVIGNYRTGEIRREVKASARLGFTHAKPPLKDQDKPSARVVNTRFASKDSPDTTLDNMMPLKSGTDYYFCLDIGPWDEGSMEKTPVDIPEVPEDARLVVAIFGFTKGLQLTPGADTGELIVRKDGSVTVTRQPLEQTAQLPGSSLLEERLFFPVRTPKKNGKHRLRCNIYHKQILLQSRLIHILVAGMPDGSQALSSELDYTLTRGFDPAHLGQFSEHRMSIMLNTGDDGTNNFYLYASAGNAPVIGKLDIEPTKFRGAIDMVRNTLKIVSWGTQDEWKFEWNDKDPSPYKYSDGKKDLGRLQKDLFNMAIWGHKIFTLIKGDDLEKFETVLSKPGFIQVAMKNKPSYYFPAAFIYDYPVHHDHDNLTLCPEFSDAFVRGSPLEDLECFHGNCRSAKESRGKIICPSGFWGFRHCVSMPLSIQDENVPAEIPLEDNLNISVALSEDLKLYGKHLQELKNISESIVAPTWKYATSYEQVFSSLKESPHIVYFYCHGGLVRPGQLDQDPFLEIGPKGHPDQIYKENFRDEHVVWRSPKPLVFLNGCRTAAIDPLTALNLIEPLLVESHCAGVIGTEITIFEQMATVFAEECLRRFLKGEPIGSAVRRARLKVLSQGNPLGLAYIPFVTADLKLKKSQRVPV